MPVPRQWPIAVEKCPYLPRLNRVQLTVTADSLREQAQHACDTCAVAAIGLDELCV